MILFKSYTEALEFINLYAPEHFIVCSKNEEYFIENNSETQINFPVHQYPETPKSLNIAKEKSYTGKLVGIKGQYLIFEDQKVFNIRSNEGIVVRLTIN